MIKSMTAYARCQTPVEGGEISLELRSLNTRFLEQNLKMPEEWRPLEIDIRARIAHYLKRGKLEVYLRFQRDSMTGQQLELNEVLVQQLFSLSDKIQQTGKEVAPLRMVDILRWQGVVAERERNLAEHNDVVMALFDTALTELVESRCREGEKLKVLILERCNTIATLVEKVRESSPAIRDNIHARLVQRLTEVEIKGDPYRLEQELVLQLHKLDVDEELDRMQCHLKEVTDVMERDEAIGRRLDFLMQELNREANTLGSKAANIDLSGAAVDIKVLIEQMREQVQNIE
ncbi:Protein YicC [hydrothermal vent metagenome]|uniref:Protein YicC n=1 Tax=hydrothermal vent metagenome TaxID=652676 RepID=A0A3B0Z5M1_9ZZZZ